MSKRRSEVERVAEAIGLLVPFALTPSQRERLAAWHLHEVRKARGHRLGFVAGSTELHFGKAIKSAPFLFRLHRRKSDVDSAFPVELRVVLVPRRRKP